MTSQIFKWRSLCLKQDDLVFKIGTDALLLGSWIGRIIHYPKSILDVGTGCGVVALMLSEFFPEAIITAIDVDENAVNLARDNAANNQRDICITVKKESILHHQVDEVSYDLIVSNPPYFSGQLLSEKQHIRNAKHAVVNPHQWLAGCVERLNNNGDLGLILPFAHAFEWILHANSLGLYCQHRLDISSYKHDVPVRSILHFNRALVKPGISKLIIYSSVNTYSREYLELTEIELAKNF